MVQLYKNAVIQTLRDRRMRSINFQYGPSRVYQTGYQDVAKLVEDGHIRFEISRNGNASYGVDSDPGQVHTWSVSNNTVEQDSSGNLRLKRPLSNEELGTIVHEATHALQDYQRHQRNLSPQMAEGSAYIASWLARLTWGFPRLQRGVDYSRFSHTYARWVAGKVLDGEITYIIPTRDVNQLNGLVLIGSPHRYVFNGI